MKYYCVTLQVKSGHLSTFPTVLVKADDAELAGDYAIYCESTRPNVMRWSSGAGNDRLREFRVNKVATVLEHEADTLRRHLIELTVNEHDLYTCGNYKDYRGYT